MAALVMEASSVEDVERIVERHEKVLVDFWSEYCKPCRQVEEAIGELLEGYNCGDLAVVRVNAVRMPEATLKYQVLGLPTVLVFQGGVQKERVFGPVDVDRLASMLGCKEH